MKFRSQHFTLSLIAAATLTLTACGGGGGGGATTATTATPAATTPVATTPTATTAAAFTPVTTTVMDGLITNAQVCVDANNDGICQATETQGRTDSSGQVTLNVPTASLTTTKLVAQVGLDATDADTGVVKTAYSLQTPVGKLNVISPLTTLVQTKIDNDKAAGINTTIEAAETHVKSQIGLTSTTVSVFDDYVSKRGSSNEHKKASDFATATVLSIQKSKEREAQAVAAGTPSTCSTGSSSRNNEGNEGNEGNDSHVSNDGNDSNELNEHTQETHIESNLLASLGAIRNFAESDHNGMSSDELKYLAPYVSTCAATTNTTAGTSTGTGGTTTTPATTTPTAQTAAGKSSYATLCAACHGASPANNVSKILKGAGSSATILNAISSNKGGMGFLSGSVNSTISADIAAYLAAPY